MTPRIYLAIGLAVTIAFVVAAIWAWEHGQKILRQNHKELNKTIDGLIEHAISESGNHNFWITITGVGGRKGYSFHYFAGSVSQRKPRVFNLYTNLTATALFGSRSPPIEEGMVLRSTGEPIFTITKDGRVHFGEGVEPTEAAKTFAEELKRRIGRWNSFVEPEKDPFSDPPIEP